MNLSCLLGASPEATDFTWPWLSSGKCSSFAVFIFGFPSVLLGLQLILSFWVASWAAGTKSSSKQFAQSFPEDLGFARSLGGLDLGPPGPRTLIAFGGEEGSVTAACTGRGCRSPVALSHQTDKEFALPWERWWPVQLPLGAGTWGRDQVCVAACLSSWQVGTARVAWVLELGLPLTQVHRAHFYGYKNPSGQTFAFSSLASCIA